MITDETYRKLKREVEDAKSESDKAKGALNQLMANLKVTFKCDTLKEAKDKLADLEEKKDKAQKAFDKALKEYEKKWTPSDD